MLEEIVRYLPIKANGIKSLHIHLTFTCRRRQTPKLLFINQLTLTSA